MGEETDKIVVQRTPQMTGNDIYFLDKYILIWIRINQTGSWEPIMVPKPFGEQGKK